MSIQKPFLRQPRVAASIVLLIFSAFAISAKTIPTTPQTTEKIFTLSEFSPVGDGVADDGPALQKALDALADAGGGKLLIPAGSYRIATPVEKDFSSVPGAKVTIQGVASSKMPAPVTAPGNELAAGLDLISEIIPATGSVKSAITLSNLHHFLIEHVGFTGTERTVTDAFITLYLLDIDQATIHHCEFYGISTFGGVPGLGAGNLVRAVRSELSIERTVFLGSTANSGGYGPVVENIDWKRFSISNSIFLDYGLRAFYGKTGLGAPLSWIGIENAAPPSPDSPHREVIVRDTFLDEGGWVGISVFPHRWALFPTPIDLVYISGLKMNVSNLHMTGHLIYDVRNILIENSHYGWSHNAYSAIHLNRVQNAILDNLTCIDHADRILTDDRISQLAVINSVYKTIDSPVEKTTVLETEPEHDPVQYVRQQFMTALGRQPDPAAHFYWSDLLIRCGSNNDCLNEKRSLMSEYLSRNPQENFSIAGTATDENGAPVSGAAISLTGSQSTLALTDLQGNFRFSGLPTSGSYTVSVNSRHYTFSTNSQIFVRPAANVSAVFSGRLHRHSIAGRIARVDGTPISGVLLKIAQSPTITATTDSNGSYSFPELAAGKDYTVVPVIDGLLFAPENTTLTDLSADQAANFIGDRAFFSLAVIVKDENGDPVSNANIRLTGSLSLLESSDSKGDFEFTSLPISGSYTVTVDKRHYSFLTNSQTFEQPTGNVEVVFSARLNRHAISGRLTRTDGTGMSGVVLRLAQSPATTATTDSNGFYSFVELKAGGSYTIVPSSNEFVFAPLNATFDDLASDRAANFVGKLPPALLMAEGSQFAIALDSVSFMRQPFSLFSPLGLSTDGFIRVMIFATNLEPISEPSQVSVEATEDTGQIHPLEVEYVGEVPGQSWLKQLNVKVPSNSLSGKCVQLRLTVAAVNSNAGRLCIGR